MRYQFQTTCNWGQHTPDLPPSREISQHQLFARFVVDNQRPASETEPTMTYLPIDRVPSRQIDRTITPETHGRAKDRLVAIKHEKARAQMRGERTFGNRRRVNPHMNIIERHEWPMMRQITKFQSNRLTGGKNEGSASKTVIDRLISLNALEEDRPFAVARRKIKATGLQRVIWNDADQAADHRLFPMG